jgi:acyl dehydratase
MAMNRALVGKRYPAATYEVTAEATKRYARAYNDENPWFLDDGRAGGIVAPPLFGVVVIGSAQAQAAGDRGLDLNFRRALHGEQDMEFFRPVRPGDTISTTSSIDSIETKSSGETLTVALDSRNGNGEPVQHVRFTLFVRGEAGAGEEKPSATRAGSASRLQPAVVVAQRIDADQTYRYADASGDRTPIHLDEQVARKAGLPGIIVHGLCTMAFTSKVIIDRLANGDPTRLRRLRVRFARPVLPGETITTKVWPAGEADGERLFEYETYNAGGAPVITAGLAAVGIDGSR